MKNLINSTKEFSIHLQSILEKIYSKEEKNKFNTDWYKSIPMIYKDSLEKCFSHPKIYSFIHYIINSFEKNQIWFTYYRSNYEETIKIFNIFQFFDPSFSSFKLNNKYQNSLKKKKSEFKKNKSSYKFPLRKYKHDMEWKISCDITDMVIASTQNSYTNSFYLTDAHEVIDKILKQYFVLWDCLKNDYELYYNNSNSCPLNILHTINPNSKIKNEDLLQMLKNNKHILESFLQNSSQSHHKNQLNYQIIYNHFIQHEKFLILLFYNKCSEIIEFWDLDSINKVNRDIQIKNFCFALVTNTNSPNLKNSKYCKKRKTNI